MSNNNTDCRYQVESKLRNIQCELPIPFHPKDMTRISICQPALPVPSTKNPFCGCPKDVKDCWDCYPPEAVETRILRPPQLCLKQPCNYTIPVISCMDPCEPEPPLLCDPLCFDWTVDEPGPNDSYGLNGLNWHDWKMEEITRNSFQPIVKGFKPQHPGFTNAPAPPDTPVYISNQPMECYGAQRCCKRQPFARDVNYFRDWRCHAARLPHPWKPPHVHWATNQHL